MDRCQTRVDTNLLGLVIFKGRTDHICQEQVPTKSHPVPPKNKRERKRKKEKPQLELDPNLTRIQIFGTHIFRGGLLAMKIIQMHK